MNCHSCSRTTLSLFIQSLSPTRPLYLPQTTSFRNRIATFSSTASSCEQEHDHDQSSNPRRGFRNNRPQDPKHGAYNSWPRSEPQTFQAPPTKKKERWQVQKEALKEKFNGEAWNPRKKLSPDTMEGIRHLHTTHPEKFTTPVLAQHFKVSPEAIRRILKSLWRPSDEETEERLARWDRRGEKIWTNLVELGVKPPKKWRQMGVGRGLYRKESKSRRPKKSGSNAIPWDNWPKSHERTPAPIEV